MEPQNQDDWLAPFRGFVSANKEVLVGIITFGAAPVLLNWIFAIGPPWPHATGVAAFTSVVTWLEMMYAFSAWERLSAARLRLLCKVFVGIASCALVLYVFLNACFVYDAPDYRHQEAGGFLIKPEVQLLLQSNPEKSLEDLLESAEYKPARVWIGWSVSVVRAGLLIGWLAFFCSLASVISSFVLLQRSLHNAKTTTRVSSNKKPQAPEIA